jgi:anaerobic selenocysteine-containing dehydrogenase
VVVDPKRTRTAEHACEHVPIRPGTDAHLLLAMVHILFAEGLVDLGAAAAFVAGVDEVERLARDFSPEAVAPLCGIAPATIRRLARELAAAPGAAVYGRTGTCTQAFGTIASWMIDVLNVLTGNLDRPGGAMFPKPAAGAPNTAGAPRYGRKTRAGALAQPRAGAAGDLRRAAGRLPGRGDRDPW